MFLKTSGTDISRTPRCFTCASLPLPSLRSSSSTVGGSSVQTSSRSSYISHPYGKSICASHSITIEDAQKCYPRSGLTFLDDPVAAFSTHSLLVVNSFPNYLPEWDGKPSAKQTWKNWTGYFGPLHLALRRDTKASTVRGFPFGTSAATSSIHGITPSYLSGAVTGTVRGGPAMTIIDQFGGNFESLTSVATNRNVVLERLTATTTTQYNNIIKLLIEITANSTNTNSAAAATGTCTMPPPHHNHKHQRPRTPRRVKVQVEMMHNPSKSGGAG